MEVAAAAVAFPPLIILIQKTVKSMYRCAKSLSSARAKVLDLANETSIFAELLLALHNTTMDVQKMADFKPVHLDATVCQSIAKQGKVTVRLINKSLRKLEPLQSNSRSSQLKIVFARLRWLINAEDFTHISISMNSVKTSAMLFSGILQLEIMLHKCQRCVANDQAIPEDLRSQVIQYRNHNLFEQRPRVIVRCGSLQWAQFVVKESSTSYPGDYVQNVGVAVDHSRLNKFASFADEGYHTVRKVLQDILPPQLPPIEVRPISRAPMYTERIDLSEEISQTLWPLAESDGDRFSATIEEYRYRYNPIIWLDASTGQNLRQSFHDAAIALKISVDPRTVDQEGPLSRSPLVIRVQEWLADRDEGDPRWLVVVDNADNIDHHLKAVIPQGPRGHVIMTSQTQLSFQLFDFWPQRLRVESMQINEARALLMKRMRIEGISIRVPVRQLLDAVAQRVGCLALAIDMAGAVLMEEIDRACDQPSGTISDTAVSVVLQQYLRDFDAHRDDFLRREQPDELSEYQKTVWTVWDTSIGAIKRASHYQALELLILIAHISGGSAHGELFRLASTGWNLMACGLAMDEVPAWLKTFLHTIDGRWDDFHYREAVKLLERYVFVQQIPGDWPGTMMHIMVQWRAKKAGKEQGPVWEKWVWWIMVAAAVQTNQDNGRLMFRRHLVGSFCGLNRLRDNRQGLSGVD